MDRLDFIEGEARANMAFHLRNLDALKKETQDTLSLLFLIISGASGYTIKLLSDGNYGLAFVFACVTIYLSCIAGYLAMRCLATGEVMPPSNEPQNLISNEYTLEELRKLDLERLQRGIDFNRSRNETLGKRLNRARLLVCCSPVVFLMAWIILLAWFFIHAIARCLKL